MLLLFVHGKTMLLDIVLTLLLYRGIHEATSRRHDNNHFAHHLDSVQLARALHCEWSD